MLDALVSLFWLVIYGVPLFAMLVFVVNSMKDYGKPRRRRSKSNYSYRQPRKKWVNYGPQSEFKYVDNESPSEFVVYFIENPRLNALKIGVGQPGRVHQLLNSHVEMDDESENTGWRVLRVAEFSYNDVNYAKGREKAYEAERRVKFYWKSQGNEPFLTDVQMGYSKVNQRSTGEIIWIRTQGWSETVEMGKVCEVSSWKYVTSSPGFIGEITDFLPGRELLLLNAAHAERTRPPDLKFPSQQRNNRRPVNLESGEDIDNAADQTTSHKYKARPKSDGTQEGAFRARTKQSSDSECIIWIGSVLTNSGYGTMLWNGVPTPAHRIAWKLKYEEELEDSYLQNKCGSRLCVNPEHWSKLVKDEFPCSTEFCTEKSRTVYRQGQCEKCHQRSKVIRRAVREGTAVKCPTQACPNMSTSSSINSRCVSCAAKARANKLNK